jgi:hypothetical protein
MRDFNSIPSVVYKRKGRIPMSVEELDAMMSATMIYFASHLRLVPPHDIIGVCFVDKHLGENDNGTVTVGKARPSDGIMWVYVRRGEAKTLGTIIHEYIHLVRDFPDGTEEKIVSTLTKRVTQPVSRLAALLLEQRKQAAAFLAHTKIAYPVKDGEEDYYDEEKVSFPDDVEWIRKYRRSNKRRFLVRRGGKKEAAV